MIGTYKQGITFFDKFAILFYFLFQMPTSKILRIIKISKKHPKFIKKIYVKNKQGIFFCSNDYEVFCSSLEGYEKPLQKFSIDEGVFIDVGANIGSYSIRFARKLINRGQVISIEPEKNNLDILKKNIKLNRLKNIKVLEYLCSNVEQELPFYINEGIGGHSLEVKTKKKIFIKSKKIDSIIKELGIDRVDLIKIDVEGHESKVLMGALNTLKKFHPKIIFESWDIEHLEEVKNVLYEFNYKIEKTGELNNYFAYVEK
ncbi:MAG TPA: FkbM family methyltransferase [Caldisericia bacterium]|nr:FkbM family methyltransferase [Caldisericia bacterium]